jgi:type 1 glutamine amidotransferase
MKVPAIRLLLAVAVCLNLVGSAAAAGEAVPPVKRILFFSKSSGFEHSVIKDPAQAADFVPKPGSTEPGLAFRILQQLGAAHQIDFVFSKDGRIFTPDYLAQFDAFFFYTSGDLTQTGLDKNPAMTPEGKAALLAAIAGGKGFIGTHSASDTFHSLGNQVQCAAWFQNDGERTDDYIKMVGGEFIGHGQQQLAHLIVVDPNFPGAYAIPADGKLLEEWYTLKDFPSDLHVILAQDTSGMRGWQYARPAYPSTWARRYGQGRVFYTSLGHRDDVWKNPMFQALLLGGINWAVGRVDADLTPNLAQATPGANVLETYVPPKAR